MPKPSLNRYSVLLLYPDYCSDSFGQETYYSYEIAGSPTEALTSARKRCMADELAPKIYDPEDLFCLLIVRGHRRDYTSAAMETTHDPQR